MAARLIRSLVSLVPQPTTQPAFCQYRMPSQQLREHASETSSRYPLMLEFDSLDWALLAQRERVFLLATTRSALADLQKVN